MDQETRTAQDFVAEHEDEVRQRPTLRETDEGVFGLDSVVEDFDQAEISKLRSIGEVIRTPDRKGVRSAIALAGSAAQSKFQLFPGDCDFFERVHIVSSSREEALATLTTLMIDTVGNVFAHPDLQFAEMKLGLHQSDSKRGDETFKSGSPVNWSLADLDARSIAVEDAEGNAVLIEIGKVADNPGFVKLDWIFADREQDRIVAVTKVIDATWEAPDGTIVPLDGVLDSFYQEVYLDPESKPHVERLIDRAQPSGLREYVEQLDSEILKYTAPGKENYGKVAKRLYNIFRITNRTEPAMFLRSLFDDPAARLYQVPAALYALGQTLGKAHLSAQVVAAQIESMITACRECYTGDDLEEVVERLRKLPDLPVSERQGVIDDLTERVNADVSNYFEDVLLDNPDIAGYIALVRERATS